MAKYRISGVWKDPDNVVTHYAFHIVKLDSAEVAIKKSKSEAIALLETPGNIAYTWVWNYSKAAWGIGQKVEVVNSKTGKYLRSDPDNKLTDNLGHIIDFDWIA